jgi:hypothetical protein
MVGGIQLECDRPHGHDDGLDEEHQGGVGLGVKASDICEWLDNIPEEENAYAEYK